jgi:hypothetical protein
MLKYWLLVLKFLLLLSHPNLHLPCKVCSLIEVKYNFLIPTLDSFWKHVGHCKVLVAMPRVHVGQHYFLKSIAHVVNEKFYVAKGLETMFDVNHSWCSSISWQEKEDCVVCPNISFIQSWPPCNQKERVRLHLAAYRLPSANPGVHLIMIYHTDTDLWSS